jgi:uncharacterized alpha-E superfamily protein
MYRQQHHGITPQKVVEFLVLDRLFPRSIHYAVLEAEESLHAITGTPREVHSNPAEEQLGRLRRELDSAKVDEIINSGLHEYLDSLQTKLNRVGDGIYETFITTTPGIEPSGQWQSQG